MTMLPPRKATALRPPGRATGRAPAAPPAGSAPAGRVFALDVPFAWRAVASAAGARWDETHQVFLYRGESLPPQLAPMAAMPYSLEQRVERRLNREKPAPRPADATLTPRPHQVEGIEAILRAAASGLGGFLLADDVGLGKTITAWEAVRRLPAAKSVLVVCPLAVVAHWRRTIAALGDAGRDVVVMNYERLNKLFTLDAAAKAKVKSKKGLARRGEAEAFDVIVWDESHRLKNPAAARSKLAAKLGAEADFVLWLSATAGQNPLELSYLAPLLARTTGDKASNLKDFEQWCLGIGLGVTRGAYGKWDWRGDPADCEKVRALLFDAGRARVPAGLRRRPEDIAGWPELNRILTPIELDAETRALYAAAWTEFRREMALDPKGGNPRSGLAATLRLRQKSSLLRAGGTLELVQELLDNGHQVAVSVAFLETLQALGDALDALPGARPCARLFGALPAAEKEHQRLRFQRGETPVCLFTVEEGISLHQGEFGEARDTPRSEVIHDLRWSAIQMAQIEGRCHRDGRFAQVYWTYAEDTLEERIAGIVCRRIQSMKAMVGDDVETLREIERLLRDAAGPPATLGVKEAIEPR
jgi:hypothetical protein